jgi:hypothetical protein
VAVREWLATFHDPLAMHIVAPSGGGEKCSGLIDGQDNSNALGIGWDIFPHQCGVILGHQVVAEGDIKDAGGEIDRVPNLANGVALVKERMQHVGKVLHSEITEANALHKVENVILEQILVTLDCGRPLLPEGF